MNIHNVIENITDYQIRQGVGVSYCKHPLKCREKYVCNDVNEVFPIYRLRYELYKT